MKPITPDEVVAKKELDMPEQVIEAANELIAKNWNGTSSTFKQDSLIERIIQKMPGTERRTIFENHWIDIEDMYRAEGWSVVYDKPGYNESYAATFEFKKSTKKDRS